MKNWEEHYNTTPLHIASDDFLRQVGKTVAGKTIDKSQFDFIIESIINNLDINEYDRVLDLCCGNGLITQKISAYCNEIMGVDFSKPLIDIAKTAHSSENCDYINKSILDLKSADFNFKFSKIYMYEALQHFTSNQFETIINIISELSQPNVKIYIGSIPNKEKIWKFYNSLARKLDYLKRKILNTEAIGTWWYSNMILEKCNATGLDCTILNQNPELYTGHYRFDVLIETNSN